eukprot:gene8270-5789_t
MPCPISDPQLAASGFLGATGVAAAALGAHYLKSRLSPEKAHAFSTGAIHSILGAISGLGMHALAIAASAVPRKAQRLHMGAALVSCGSFLFAWSIYLLCLGAPRILGPVTPLGGLLMIAGWTTAATASAL